jgi:hypothetical protein
MSTTKSPLRQRITPSVPYTLDVEDLQGKFALSFRLSYDLNAFCLVEEKLGKSMLTDLAAILDKPTVTTITVLLWAALQNNHGEYGGDDGLVAVRNLVTLPTLQPALAACVEAFLVQLPKEKQDEIRLKIKAAEAGQDLPNAGSPTPASA